MTLELCLRKRQRKYTSNRRSLGLRQVDGNNVRVLAELAETADEIDLPRAQEAEKKAKELLQSGIPPHPNGKMRKADRKYMRINSVDHLCVRQ
ncbi:MAG: hypothetical protein Ct9H300mP28_24000 [Pseudomonadota bacterium]|nr:MAG: hypothetical protein Ct9H300mP28_24000 [Pseudomonadota bacterium]